MTTHRPPRSSPTAGGRTASARLGLPHLGIGVGLRAPHYRHLLDTTPDLDVIEVLTDNYLGETGRPLEVLDVLATQYPVVLHGVGLSIGAANRLDRRYLRQVARLRDRCRAAWVSDHLCFTGVGGRTSHDLLPLPYTAAVLDHVADRVRAAQDVLGAPLILENPSTYLQWSTSDVPEEVFLAELCHRTGCGLLVDVNNLWVNAHNHHFSPTAWLDGIPWDRVVQFHVAGHSQDGDMLVDTHDGPVIPAVWDLLREAHQRCTGATVVLEWDADVPDFPTVLAEARRADAAIGAIP